MPFDVAAQSIAKSIIETATDDIPKLFNDLCCSKQLHVAVHALNEELQSLDPVARSTAETALNRLGFI